MIKCDIVIYNTMCRFAFEHRYEAQQRMMIFVRTSFSFISRLAVRV